MIKILIGGSPCTFWSIAQTSNRETEAKGMGWELFKNYLIAKEKFRPDFFLYENNKSAAQAIKDQISRELGVDLMHINSALVSAQNRQRFYAFNWSVEQPEDRGILLKDILESGYPRSDKSDCIDANYWKGGNLTRFDCQSGRRLCVFEPVGVGYRNRREDDGKLYRRFETSGEPKANALTTVQTDSMVAVPVDIRSLSQNVGECATVQKAIPEIAEKVGYVPEMFNAYNRTEITDKAPTLSTGSMVTSSCAVTKFEKVEKEHEPPIYEVVNGEIEIKGKKYPIKLADGCFTNVTYYAYEIDEHAMKVAMSNYPDIIQLGDAFNLRRDDWELGKRYDDAPPTVQNPAEGQEEQEEHHEYIHSESGADTATKAPTTGADTVQLDGEVLQGSEDPEGVRDLAEGEKEPPGEGGDINAEESGAPSDVLAQFVKETLDEFLKRSIIEKLTTALKNAGVEPEPELLERLNGSALKEVGAVAVAFPGYITAAILARDIKEGAKNEI